MKTDKAAIAANWLSNPALPYVVAGLGAVVAAWLLIKLVLGKSAALYEGAKAGSVAVATDVVDTLGATVGQVSTIVGKPSTELPGQQTFTDKLKGLLAGGDSRTWSDLLD